MVDYFAKQFSIYNTELKRSQIKTLSLSMFPRPFLEGVLILVFLIVVVLNKDGQFDLGTAALFTYSFLRILPSAQLLFDSINRINYSKEIIRDIKDFDNKFFTSKNSTKK